MELDLFALAGQLYQAVMGGQWALFAALLLMGIIYALRKYLAPKLPLLATDEAGVLMAFFGSLSGAFATAFAAGQTFSLALCWTAFKVAFLAMGGYVALKKLFAKPLAWLMGKLGMA